MPSQNSIMLALEAENNKVPLLFPFVISVITSSCMLWRKIWQSKKPIGVCRKESETLTKYQKQFDGYRKTDGSINLEKMEKNWDKLDDAAFVGENAPLRVMPLLNAPFTSGSVETVTQEET